MDKSSQKQRVMVLGALEDEIPLVNAFKLRGYEVIVVGKGAEYPCSKVADRFYDVDIRNGDALLDIARNEKVVAVASNVVSIAVDMTAWLAEQLELPGIGYDIAHGFTNKALMRERAKAGGVSVPPFTWARTREAAVAFARETGFPLVMKPIDGNSSKGVARVDSVEEIEEKFEQSASFSLNDPGVIIEGFIEGKEYIVNAFSHKGECINTDVAYKEHFKLKDKFVSKAVVIKDAPHCNTPIEKKLLETHKKTVEALGLPYGPTHGEYILCPKDNKAYLVEVAARGGGIRLSSDMIPLATGIDISELIADYSLGNQSFQRERLGIKEGAAAWFAFSLKQGRITGIFGVEACLKMEGVHFIDTMGLVIGDKTRILENDSGKYGPIIVYGKSRQECYQIFEKVKQKLVVEVDGKPGIIW